MNRRDFFSLVGLGGLISASPVAIAACSNQTTSSQPGSFRAIGSLSDLEKKGFLLSQQNSNAPVLVLRDPNDAQRLLAVNPTCTHKGCTVEWKADDKHLFCPCHDAKFAADGKVLEGPAKDPLPTYEAKIEQDTIFVAA